MRWLDEIGKWTAVIAGAISIFLALAHLFGWMELRWFQERLPLLFAVILGLVLEILAVVSFRQQQDSRVLEEHLQRDQLTQLVHMRDKVDHRLQQLVGGEIDHVFTQVKTVLGNNTLQLNHAEKFRAFYLETLGAYPGREFWATSVPSRKYFWRNDDVEIKMHAFLRAGGVIKRIFFVNSEEELHSPEAQEILSRQKQIGVQVHVAMAESISPELLRFFVVESHGEIAWETFRGPDSSIRSVKVVAGLPNTTEYLQNFRELLRLPCVHRY